MISISIIPKQAAKSILRITRTKIKYGSSIVRLYDLAAVFLFVFNNKSNGYFFKRFLSSSINVFTSLNSL